MPERFVQLRGASVNAREKWATHWLLGIFDTVGCPLIVYTDSSGLLCKTHRAQRSHGFGETAAVIHPPLPSRMLSWSEMAQEGASIHAALAGRRQMAWGNAERGIPVFGEVAVIAAMLPIFCLPPVLLFMLFALLTVRFIFPLVGHRRGSDGRHQ
jgi:hypothetical protein